MTRSELDRLAAVVGEKKAAFRAATTAFLASKSDSDRAAMRAAESEFNAAAAAHRTAHAEFMAENPVVAAEVARWENDFARRWSRDHDGAGDRPDNTPYHKPD